jgi:syntaxin-binding protein 5
MHKYAKDVWDIIMFPLSSSVKTRPVRMPPGYQADLVIQLVWVDGEPPQQITSLSISSAYGM